MRGKTAKRLRRIVGQKVLDAWVADPTLMPKNLPEAMGRMKRTEQTAKRLWKTSSKPKSLGLASRSSLTDRFVMRRLMRIEAQKLDGNEPLPTLNEPEARSAISVD